MSDRPPDERRDEDAVANGSDGRAEGLPRAPVPPSAGARPSNGTGVGALVVGLLALVLSVLFFPLGVLLGIVAVILGVLGRKKAARGEATNGGVAVAGITTGVIAVAIGVLVAIFVGGFIADNADEIDDLAECLEQAGTDQAADECAAEFEDEIGSPEAEPAG